MAKKNRTPYFKNYVSRVNPDLHNELITQAGQDAVEEHKAREAEKLARLEEESLGFESDSSMFNQPFGVDSVSTSLEKLKATNERFSSPVNDFKSFPKEENMFDEIAKEIKEYEDMNNALFQIEEEKRLEPTTKGQENLKNNLPPEDYSSYKTEVEEYEALKKRTFAERFKKGRDTLWNDPFKESENDGALKAAGKGLANSISNLAKTIVAGGLYIDKNKSDIVFGKQLALSEEEEKRFDELEKKINTVERNQLKPDAELASKRYQEIQKTFVQDQKKFKQDVARWDLKNDERDSLKNEYFKKKHIHDIYKSIDHDYKDAMDDSASLITNSWRGFTKDRLGILKLTDDVEKADLIEEINKKAPELRTELDNQFLQAIQDENLHKSKPLVSSHAYETMVGVRGSAEFIGETILTGGVQGAVAKGTKAVVGATLKEGSKQALKQALAKGTSAVMSNVIGKAAVRTAQLGTTAMMLPSTHQRALEGERQSLVVFKDAADNIQSAFRDEDKLAIGTNLKKDIVILNSDISRKEMELNKLFGKLKKSEDPSKAMDEKAELLNAELDDLYKQRANLVTAHSLIFDEKGELRTKNSTYGQNLFKEGVNNFKEVFSEKYIGNIVDGFLPVLGSTAGKYLDKVGRQKVLNSRLGKEATKKLTKFGDEYQRLGDAFESGIHKTFGDAGILSRSIASGFGPSKMINSLPGEFAEEMFIQMTPSIGSDYFDNLKELTDSSFYSSVGLQTLIIGAGSKTIGGASILGRYATDAEFRENYKKEMSARKDMMDLYKRLDKAVDDPTLAQDIAMATLGTVYDQQDYAARIANLRDPKSNNPADAGLTYEQKLEKANHLEKISFINLANESIKTGTARQFERALRGIYTNENLEPETRENARKGIERISDLRQVFDRYKEMPNFVDILRNRESSLNYNQSIQDADKYISKNRKEAVSDLDKFYEVHPQYTKYSLDSLAEVVGQEDDAVNLDKRNVIGNLIKFSPIVHEVLESMVNRNELVKAKNKADLQLQWELNPNNKAEIAKRNKQRLEDAIKKNEIAAESVEEVKEELIKTEEVTSNQIAELNENAVDNINRKKPAKKLKYGLKQLKKGVRKPVEKVGDKVSEEEYLKPILTEEEAMADKVETSIGVLNQDEIAQEGVATIFDNAVELPTIEMSTVDNTDNFLDLSMMDEDDVEQGFYAPIERNPGQDDNLIKSFRDAVENTLSNQPQVSINGLLVGLFSAKNFGPLKTDKYFNYIIDSWNDVTGENVSKAEATDLYDSLFPNESSLSGFDKIGNSFVGTQNTIEVTHKKPEVKEATVVESIEQKSVEQVVNVPRGARLAPHTANSYREIGAKFGGVLGIQYVKDGAFKIDITNQVNEPSLPFLDPRNFKEGSVVDLKFDFNQMLNPDAVVGRWSNLDAENKSPEDTRPTRETVTFRERVLEIFADDERFNSWEKVVRALEPFIINGDASSPIFENEEFLGIIPVGTVNKNYTDKFNEGDLLPGGLPNVDWFNNSNVALYLDAAGNPLLKERESRINSNKAINMAIRKSILKEGLKGLSLTVTNKKEVAYNKLLLKTDQEKQQGYSNTPNPLTKALGTTYEEFSELAAVGTFTPAGFGHSGGKTKQGKVLPLKPIVIGGKEITRDMISNYDDVVEHFKKSGNTTGRIATVVKLGEGNYIMLPVVTNHSNPSEQKKMRVGRLELRKFELKMFETSKKDNLTPEQVETVLRNFKQQFGYTFSRQTKGMIEQLYPKFIQVPGKEPYYSQDHPGDVLDNSLIKDVPDFFTLKSADELVQLLLENKPVPRIDKRMIAPRNLHTSVVFTPIVNNGEKIVTPFSQPYMMYNFSEDVVRQAEMQAQNAVIDTIKDNIDLYNTNLEKAKKDYQQAEDNSIEKEVAEAEINTFSNLLKKENDRLKNLEESSKNIGLEIQQNVVEGSTAVEVEVESSEEIAEEVTEVKDYAGFNFLDFILNPDPITEMFGLPDNHTVLNTFESSENNIFEMVREVNADAANDLKIRLLNSANDIVFKDFGGKRAFSTTYYNVDGSPTIVQDVTKEGLVKKLKNKTIKDLENILANGLEEKIFNDQDAHQIKMEVIGRLFKGISITNEAIKLDDLMSIAENRINGLISELKDNGFSRESNFVLENKNYILGIEEGSYDNSLKEYLSYMFEIDMEEQDSLEVNQENVKQFDTSSYEIDPQRSLSFQVKLLMSGVKDTRFGKTFGGMYQTLDSSEVLDAIKQVLADMDNNSIEDLKNALESKFKSNPSQFGFFDQILERVKALENTNPEILNEILYSMYQSKLDMKFVMWSRAENGKILLESYNANSKNPLFTKRADWMESLKQSSILDMYEGIYYKINEKMFEELTILRDNLVDKNVEDIAHADLERFLKIVGIKLTDRTYKSIYDGEIVNDIDIQYSMLVGNNSIINLIHKNFEQAYNYQGNEKLTLNNNPGVGGVKFDLLFDDNSRLNDLINIDNNSEFLPASTIRVADKSINVYQQPNPITNKIKKLKESVKEYIKNLNDPNIPEDQKIPGLLNELLNTPITSQNLVLKELKNNPHALVDYVDTFLISLEALKEVGTNTRDDMGVTGLSEKDSFSTHLGMFISTEGTYESEELTNTYGGALTFRKGYATFPTVSDSSQLPFLKSILVNVDNSLVNPTEDRISEELLDFMKDKLVLPELLRTADFISKLGVKSSNIQGYDTGANFISSFTSLNGLQLPYKYTRKNGEVISTTRSLPFIFKELIENESITPDEAGVREFLKKYSNEINKEITDNISFEADKYINKEGNEGLFIEEDLIDRKGNLKLDGTKASGKSYFKNKTPRLVAYDYVINNFIQQREIQTLFAGDLAYYFKDKMVDSKGLGDYKSYKHLMPRVSIKDMIRYYEKGNKPNVYKEVLNLLGTENESQIVEKYPYLQYADELVKHTNPDFEDVYHFQSPVAALKFNQVFKEVQNNLSKRLKGQISPGNQLVNSKNTPNYYQIAINDSETASLTFEDLVRTFYSDEKAEQYKDKIQRFITLNNTDNLNSNLQKEHDALEKELKKEFDTISAYLKTNATDAQEYTTWQENLNQLRDQGRISPSDYKKIKTKLEAQEKELDETGTISQENRLTHYEAQKMIMQTTKPLYSGLVNTNVDGHNISRYVYVKSSSFPLIPELTMKFDKLNNMRKNLLQIEGKLNAINDGKRYSVRAAYQSAIKVGSSKKALSLAELQDPELPLHRLIEAGIELDRDNFYIQQDKPFKSDKNAKAGKEDRVTRATQFEKILLGDGINQITDYVFPIEHFDKELLNLIPDLNFNKDKTRIDGPSLKKIYTEIYKREQQLLKNKLFNKLKIKSFDDIAKGDISVMEELSKVLKREVKRKQDKKALDLVYIADVEVNTFGGSVETIEKAFSKQQIIDLKLKPKRAEFRIPLMVSPNSRKFESVLNSIIAKNSINLTMPGFSSPVASQAGFDYIGLGEDGYSMESLKEKGLIVTPNFDPSKGLQSVRDAKSGKLKLAQVFIASKYKYYDNKKGTYEYVNLMDYVNPGTNVIDTNKIPEDLLSMFSFRIPTSSAQSGTLIEIAGFLPHSMGDVMIVPKDHTVQIGEDFDIDTRYVYQYNIIKDKDGNLKKVEYSDIDKISEKEFKNLQKEYEQSKLDLWNTYFYKDYIENKDIIKNNSFWNANKNVFLQLNELEDVIESLKDNTILGYEIEYIRDEYDIQGPFTVEALEAKRKSLKSEIIPSNLVKAEANRLRKEFDHISKNFLKEKKEMDAILKPKAKAYQRARAQKANESKVLENGLVSMYKSVFSSPDKQVQQLITKVLSTDFAEDTASIIDAKRTANQKYFNIYSAATQRKVMKLGADGKMGIGVHSNAVTFNSMIQQTGKNIGLHWKDGKGNVKPFNIVLGDQVFDGVLGRIFDQKGFKRISEYLMQSQNSSTDNQKLEIMGRRNENAETIGVFSLMQMNGLEFDGLVVDGKEVSYASLFISQPIIQEYVKLVKQYKSAIKNTDVSLKPHEIAEKVVDDLRRKYMKDLPDNFLKKNKAGKIQIPKALDQNLNKDLNARFLLDSINNQDSVELAGAAHQVAILNAFVEMSKAATTIMSVQSILNIENGGLGVSFFDTIDMVKNLRKMYDSTSFGRFEGEVFINGLNDLVGETLDFAFESYMKMDLPDGEKRLSKQEFADENEFIMITEGLWIKPSTPAGQKIVNSLSTGYNLWKNFLPYNESTISGIINEVAENSETRDSKKDRQKLNYKVFSSMKDYSYTNAKMLFDGNQDYHIDRIFFDDKKIGKESLASYLQRIKTLEFEDVNLNLRLKSMFNNAFFRDLKMDINDVEHPSTISYNNNDKSPMMSLLINNSLESMINSNLSLPDKLDGTKMTEADLMKDLLMYAIIADQNNGATGFRDQLPMSLFEKYKLDSVLRARNSSDSTRNRTYDGIQKYFISELGLLNDFNEFGELEIDKHIVDNPVEFNRLLKVIDNTNKMFSLEFGSKNRFTIEFGDTPKIIDNEFDGDTFSTSLFVEQYFQHNPGEVGVQFESNSEDIMSIAVSNGLKHDAFDRGVVSDFTTTLSHDFIVVNDSNGKPMLYKLNMKRGGISTYKRLPILGAFGFNEYNAHHRQLTSKVEANNFLDFDSIVNHLDAPASKENTFVSRDPKEFSEVVRNILKNSETESSYSAAFKLINDYLPYYSESTVQVVGSLKGAAVYNPSTNEIKLNSEVLNSGVTKNEVHALLVEEGLHHLTNSVLTKYVDIKGVNFDTGDIVFEKKEGVESVPKEIQVLFDVYKYAFDYYKNKHGESKLKEALNYHTKQKTAENGSIEVDSELSNDAYRLLDIHEFVAGIFLKNKEFSKELGQVQYRKSGKTILEKFADVLMRLFSRLLPGAKRDSVSTETANAIITLLTRDVKQTQTTFIENFGGSEVAMALRKGQNLIKKFGGGVQYIYPSEATLISGGAEGSDSYFDEVATEYGVGTKNIIKVDYLSKLSDTAKENVEKQYRNVVKALGRVVMPFDWKDKNSYNDYSPGGLVRRDILQANRADAIYAVGYIINPGELSRDGKYPNKSGKQVIDGGTGYAVERAIQKEKPVYVFDQKHNSWFIWDSISNSFERIEGTPRLLKNFAGVGTRNLEDNGKQAIKDLFENSYKTQPSIVEDNKINFSNLIKKPKVAYNAEHKVDLKFKSYSTVDLSNYDIKGEIILGNTGKESYLVYYENGEFIGLISRNIFSKNFEGTKLNAKTHLENVLNKPSNKEMLTNLGITPKKVNYSPKNTLNIGKIINLAVQNELITKKCK